MLRSIVCLTLLINSLLLQAEPLYPRLRKASIADLQTRLAQSRYDSNRVNLLLQLSEHAFLCSDWDFHPDLNKAYQYLNKARSLSASLKFSTGWIKSLLVEGHLLAKKRDKPKAKALFRRVIQQSRQHRIKFLEADGWCYLGELYGDNQDEQNEKIRYYQQAMILYRQIGNVKNEAYMLKNIADVHLWLGNTEQSRSELLQVLKLYQSIGYPKLHYTYDLLGCANRNLGNQKEALTYGLAAVASARATKDTFDLGLFNWRLGEYYLELNLLDESTAYYKEALLEAKKAKKLNDIFSVAESLSRNLIAQKKPRQALNFNLKLIKSYPPTDDECRVIAATTLGDCYLALKQYDEAERHYLRMLTLAGDESTDVCKRLTNLYLITHQYTKARTFLVKATRLKIEYGDSSLRAAQLHLLSFKVDSARGNYPAAIDHYQTYKALNDYILGQTKSQQIASLRIKFDSDKKDQAIRLLQKESKLQIEKAQAIRNLSIAGAIMLVLLMGVIYNRYRMKKRSNQLLEAKQQLIDQKNHSLELLLEEKEWMLKEIHHRVKNNLQIITSLLDSQAIFLEDRAALSAIRESQNRVHSMALIHQKLYQSEQLSVINMSDYITEIVDYLIRSYDRQNSVQKQISVAPIRLDVTVAVPLGLIINEVVTNSLKYAFATERRGMIRVELTQFDSQMYQLLIEDDGIGLPADFDPDLSRSLGMSLIKGLSIQLDGELQISQQNGVQISLTFPQGKIKAESLVGQ